MRFISFVMFMESILLFENRFIFSFCFEMLSFEAILRFFFLGIIWFGKEEIKVIGRFC